MLKKHLAVWTVEPYLRDNFFAQSSVINQDDRLAANCELQRVFKGQGWDFHTYDVYRQKNIVPDVVLFTDHNLDIPIKKLLGDWFGQTFCYLLLSECEVIAPFNWEGSVHCQFRKVFTWRSDLIDNHQYIWANSFCRGENLVSDVYFKEKFCVLMNANKSADHPLELYSKREEAINWFEKNHPDEFDLYGFDWDRYKFKTMPWRAFNRIKFIGRLLAKKHQCYRGIAKEKMEIIKKHKFSICFENARDIPGYITEKIFDCFAVGCVPIYWGAPDITDYVPDNCFIDFRDFKNYADLYNFLKNMGDNDYFQYLKNIKNYMKSKAADRFSKEYFANTVVDAIIRDFNEDNRL